MTFTLTLEHGSWIPVVSGSFDSLSCIPDSKPLNSEFSKQNCSGLQIPPVDTGKNFPDPEI